jgi:hypothetical protein
MRDKATLSTAKTLSFDPQAKSYIDSVLADFNIGGLKGKAERIEPESIDVGSAATNRASQFATTTTTLIDYNNAANATGTLDTFQAYWDPDSGTPDMYLGTFYLDSGTTFYCRDSVQIGDVTTGSTQTYTGLSVNVTTGDYIGCCDKKFPSVYSYISKDSSGYSGVYRITSEKIDPGDNGSYSLLSGDCLSLYATGTETAAYSLTNAPDSKAFGVVAASSTYYAKGSAPSNPISDGECTFTITNDSAGAEDIDIKCSNFTGGVGWTLAGSTGENQVKITAYYSGQNPASGIVLTTSDQEFYDGLAASATIKWDFSLATGTFTDGAAKTATITLTARAEN